MILVLQRHNRLWNLTFTQDWQGESQCDSYRVRQERASENGTERLSVEEAK